MNPSAAIAEAKSFYRDFHWGIPHRKVKRVKVAPRPRALVKLGKLEGVTYSTNKKGDGFSHYEHAFGEEGGKKPVLAVDVESKKLHVVGGDYKVEDRGIVD